MRSRTRQDQALPASVCLPFKCFSTLPATFRRQQTALSRQSSGPVKTLASFITGNYSVCLYQKICRYVNYYYSGGSIICFCQVFLPELPTIKTISPDSPTADTLSSDSVSELSHRIGSRVEIMSTDLFHTLLMLTFCPLQSRHCSLELKRQ